MIEKKKVAISDVKTARVNTKDFCIFAKQDDCCEVIQWTNGNGFDIIFIREESRNDLRISLTWGEYAAIKKCVPYISK